jgi:hypothetical protein
VNGYDLYPISAHTQFFYAVPELGTTIFVAGPDGQRVLATIAASAKYVALNYRAPVPNDWHEVSHAGITLSVPADWPQLPPVSGCGWIRSDVVTVGTATGLPSCNPDLLNRGPDHNGVEIHDATQWSEDVAGLKQSKISNATTSMQLLENTGLDNKTLQLEVYIAGTNAAPVTIGLARDGRVAAAIFDSIRIDVPAPNTASTRTPPTALTARAILGTWQPVSITGYHASRHRAAAPEVHERDRLHRIRRLQLRRWFVSPRLRRNVPSWD